MLFSVKKNSYNSWDLIPNTGSFKGRCVATAEGIDLTSVTTTVDRAIGTIKAVWGVQFNPDLDVYSDIETVRALCLGKAFKGGAESPVAWQADGIYDLDSGRILQRCHRMVILGSSIFRRG